MIDDKISIKTFKGFANGIFGIFDKLAPKGIVEVKFSKDVPKDSFEVI